MTTQKRISSALLSAKSYLNKNLKSHSQSKSVHGSPVPIVNYTTHFPHFLFSFHHEKFPRTGETVGAPPVGALIWSGCLWPAAGTKTSQDCQKQQTEGAGVVLSPLRFIGLSIFFQGSSGHPQKSCGFLHIWNNMTFLVIISWSPLWIKGRKRDMDYNLKTRSLAVWCCPAQM